MEAKYSSETPADFQQIHGVVSQKTEHFKKCPVWPPAFRILALAYGSTLKTESVYSFEMYVKSFSDYTGLHPKKITFIYSLQVLQHNNLVLFHNYILF
jgi:hypothetical protein